VTLKTKNVFLAQGVNVKDSAIHTTDSRTATDVVFYRLTKRFVEDESDTSDEALDVIYYTLAMGHNTGIIDCFDPKITIDRNLFNAILEALPDGEGKFKLSGIEKFGEIQLDKLTILDVIESLENFKFDKSVDKKTHDRYAVQRVTSAREFRDKFLKLANEVAKLPQVYVVARRVTQ
jgi:hypothetical protein